MPEPFKNLFNLQLIDAMSVVLSRNAANFDADLFRRRAGKGLNKLEMMARADQISLALDDALGENHLNNLETLVGSLHPSKTSELSDMSTDADGIAGWAIVPLAGYVARNGMGNPKESLDALREMTMRFSAEFAVRFFLRDHTDLALAKAREWAIDENHHVRRLASEGTRPLLPWGIKLHQFVEDPSSVLEILESLRNDPSEYVRKSVSNNLNDISKNHPDRVAGIAVDWLEDAKPPMRKLVKHACRTLIKAGHPETLSAFGYHAPRIRNVRLQIPAGVKLGETIPIEFDFIADQDQSLLVDYVLHFMRANGKLSPKVFKWTEIKVRGGQAKKLGKNHPYKAVTTRKDYPGQQILTVQVNGIEVARQEFDFEL